MIKKFDSSTAMLLVDVQRGVNDTFYYGGSNGRRNNYNAEANIINILNEWRLSGRKVAFTKHNSREDCHSGVYLCHCYVTRLGESSRQDSSQERDSA